MSLEETRRRSQAVETIHDIVSAMRAIAAGRIQGAQRALAGARSYEEVILRGLAALTRGAPLPWPETDGRPSLLLVMTSEQPLCGAFNQDVLEVAERRLAELREAGEVQLVVVGQRGRQQLTARGIEPDAAEPAATTVQGLRDLVKGLATMVDRQFAAGRLGALHAVYSRYQSISEQVATTEQILPLDPDRLRPFAPPAETAFYRYLPEPTLLAGLVGEYALINLFRIAADSFASEQASRLVAMDGATRNTERALEELHALERRERQGEITRQVLELIAARFAAE
jgi:F-type H+-transporting ATPase subunit gamma